MKTCPNCRSQAEDEARTCPVCGTALDALTPPPADYFKRKEPIQMPELIPAAPAPASFDHTEEFRDSDIRDSRIACMAAYLLGIPGIIIALLMAGSSSYGRFHINQALKITIFEVLIGLASVILCWTFIVPILGAVAIAVLLVIRLICFNDVRSSKATDAPLLRNIRL